LYNVYISNIRTVCIGQGAGWRDDHQRLTSAYLEYVMSPCLKFWSLAVLQEELSTIEQPKVQDPEESLIDCSDDSECVLSGRCIFNRTVDSSSNSSVTGAGVCMCSRSCDGGLLLKH